MNISGGGNDVIMRYCNLQRNLRNGVCNVTTQAIMQKKLSNCNSNTFQVSRKRALSMYSKHYLLLNSLCK